MHQLLWSFEHRPRFPASTLCPRHHWRCRHGTRAPCEVMMCMVVQAFNWDRLCFAELCFVFTGVGVLFSVCWLKPLFPLILWVWTFWLGDFFRALIPVYRRWHALLVCKPWLRMSGVVLIHLIAEAVVSIFPARACPCRVFFMSCTGVARTLLSASATLCACVGV